MAANADRRAVGGGWFTSGPMNPGEVVLGEWTAPCYGVTALYVSGKLYLTNERLLWVRVKFPGLGRKLLSLPLTELEAASRLSTWWAGDNVLIQASGHRWYRFRLAGLLSSRRSRENASQVLSKIRELRPDLAVG